MNGVPIDEKFLTEEDFEEQLLGVLMKETQNLQRAVYKNQLSDKQVRIKFNLKITNSEIVYKLKVQFLPP